MKTHGTMILAKGLRPEPQIVGNYSERNVAAIPDSRPSHGSLNPQEKAYFRLRDKGWKPMMGVLVVKMGNEVAIVDAAGEVRVAADSERFKMSDTSQPQAPASPNREAETCSLHRGVRRLTKSEKRRVARLAAANVLESWIMDGALVDDYEHESFTREAWVIVERLRADKRKSSNDGDQVLRELRKAPDGS